MAESSQSVRPSPATFVNLLAEDSEFLADVKNILELPESDFLALLSALEEYDSFLDMPTTIRITEHALKKRSNAEKIGTTIFSLNALLREHSRDAMYAAARLADTLEKIDFHVGSGAEQRTAVARIIRLVAPTGFDLFWKAHQLQKATGNEIKAISITCDMRPVFDDSRKDIIGVIPVATMSLTYGQATRIDLRLGEEQIDEFLEHLQNAASKIGAIRNFAATNELPALINPYDFS